jgi:hypothetical protein
MPALKTETITVRIEPAVKAGLKAVAVQERRSLANMIEVMIRQYCGRSGVAIPEVQAPLLKADGTSRKQER